MTRQYYFNMVFVFGLSFSIWLTGCSTALTLKQADEVKFFKSMECDYSNYSIDSKCVFKNEINKNDISGNVDYYETHYKDGRMISANQIQAPIDSNANGGLPVVTHTMEFDSSGRTILTITNPLDYFYHFDYQLCRDNFGEQSKETQCYSKDGKQKGKVAYIYKDKKLVKESYFNDSGDLWEYLIYDQKANTRKVFNADHKLLNEVSPWNWQVD